MALPIMQVCAVPFTFSPPSENSIAARRRQYQRPISAQQEQRQQLSEDTRRNVASVLAEAANAIQSAIALDGGGRQDQPVPVVPPNSPNENNVFTFSSSSSEEEEASPKKVLKKLRKRRRVPSFKSNTAPRVPPKLTCSSEEADDEAEDEEDDNIENQELRFRLTLLSEKPKFSPTDWAKVGEELRHLADSFSPNNDENQDGHQPENNAAALDILSLVKSMLPVTLSQPMWSALVSYAAWKLIKRFQ